MNEHTTQLQFTIKYFFAHQHILYQSHIISMSKYSKQWNYNSCRTSSWSGLYCILFSFCAFIPLNCMSRQNEKNKNICSTPLQYISPCFMPLTSVPGVIRNAAAEQVGLNIQVQHIVVNVSLRFWALRTLNSHQQHSVSHCLQLGVRLLIIWPLR